MHTLMLHCISHCNRSTVMAAQESQLDDNLQSLKYVDAITEDVKARIDEIMSNKCAICSVCRYVVVPEECFGRKAEAACTNCALFPRGASSWHAPVAEDAYGGA